MAGLLSVSVLTSGITTYALAEKQSAKPGYALNVTITDDAAVDNEVSAKIKVKDVSSSKATLYWDAAGLFNNYRIYQYDFILKKWMLYDSVRVSEIELEKLSSGMFYKFKVAVPTADGLRENVVGDVSFITKPKTPSVSLEAYGATCVTLSLESEKTPTSFKIYRKDGNGKFKLIDTVDGSKTQYEDTSLEPKTNYEYKIKSVVENSKKKSESKYSKTVEVKTGKTMKLPKVSGACKTYAYYTAVTDKTSAAYAVLNSGTYKGVTYETYTDDETGIRMVDDCYCAALGTYYGTEKGTKYRITLKSGETFKIILCDTKSNRHTDKKHQYAKKNKDIVEFYVDKDKIPDEVNGNYNVLEQFNGPIASIEKITQVENDTEE